MVESTGTPGGEDQGSLVRIEAEAVVLNGILHIPAHAKGLVMLINSITDADPLSHQSALSQAQSLYEGGLATLLVDLFTHEEEQIDQEAEYFRLNTDIMQQRIIGTADWLLEELPETRHFSLGYFGAGVSGAAALIAAANRPDVVAAVVAAGARLDLVKDDLRRIMAPTMLIAAEKNEASVNMSQHALEQIEVEKQFELVRGVSSLYEDASAVDEVARLAGQWFTRHLVTIA